MAPTGTEWVVGLTAVGGVVQVALAVIAVRNREVGAAGAYGLVSLVAGAWALLQVAVVVRPAGVDPVVFYRVAKVVANQLPVVWLLFAVVYAGHREWLTPPRVVALWIPPPRWRSRDTSSRSGAPWTSRSRS